ncbi:hypothetical protein D3C81_1233760 [compost metagenome]
MRCMEASSWPTSSLRVLSMVPSRRPLATSSAARSALRSGPTMERTMITPMMAEDTPSNSMNARIALMLCACVALASAVSWSSAETT